MFSLLEVAARVDLAGSTRCTTGETTERSAEAALTQRAFPALAFECADLFARGRIQNIAKRLHGATAPFALRR